jgi:hypothetical protein
MTDGTLTCWYRWNVASSSAYFETTCAAVREGDNGGPERDWLSSQTSASKGRRTSGTVCTNGALDNGRECSAMKIEVPMENSFVLIVLLFAALTTGGLIVNWIGLGRAMSRLSVSADVEFHQRTNRTFDPYMPIVVIGALAEDVALAVRYDVDSIPGQLAAAGAACYALVIIIGVPACVRINHQIASWSIQNPPREWAQMRARWIRFTSFERYSPFPRFPFIFLP